MILRDFLPSSALKEFVQWYRICHFEFDKTDYIPIKAYPPKPEEILHFFLRDFWAIQKGDEKNRQPSMVLAGQRTSLVKQFTGSNSFINVQIVFQPTAVFRLTGIPAHELTNQHIEATFIFHNNIQFTLEQLQAAKNYAEMLTIIEDFAKELIYQSRKNRLLDTVSRQMIQQGGNISLDWLADEACLCTKQFKRKFKESVGVNPKTYARIIRFNRAFNLKNRYPARDWLGIAIECGYYDYQHLVKDYKEFTGLTPHEFHLLESQSPERILGLTDSIYRDRVSPLV